MITYNHEAYIAEAIEGVLTQQTDFPIELVIGDDCSTDQTREICLEFQARFPQIIRVLPEAANVGMMPNLVRTLLNCRGKYVALCEGDDYWTDPAKTKLQLEFLESEQIYSGIGSAVQKLYQNSGSFEEVSIPGKHDIRTEDLLSSAYIHTTTIMFRAKLFDPEILAKYSWGDRFILLLISNEGPIRYSPDPTAVYRVHSGGAMHILFPNNIGRYFNDYIDFLHEYNSVTNRRFDALIAKKISYIQILRNISLQSRTHRQKILDIIRYFLRDETRFSLEEVFSSMRLAFPGGARRLKAVKSKILPN
jgi:glycosyltransferase involved in cell wall biosynthesis